MLKFALRTVTTKPPSGYVGLIGLSGGGLATVDASGTVTPLQGGGAVSVSVSWAGLTGKPSSYPPSVHSHVPSEITGLQAMLDSISAGGVADGSKGDVTVSSSGTVWSIATFAGSAKGLVPASAGGTTNFLRADGSWEAPSAGGATWGAISGTLSSQTDLNSALAGKQPLATVLTNTTASFTTAQETKLAGIATGATVNSSDATLLARANHTGTQAASTISDFTEASQDVIGAMVVAAGGSYDDAAGTITLPSGGTDPWTYTKLASDFTTTSATAVDVTGLSFTPAANKSYEFEALLLCRTATTTVGPRPGLAWPTGGTDGVADIAMPTSATAQVLVFGNINAALLAAVGGLPNTTQSYPSRIRGIFIAGASPSGTVKVQIASETAGTTVTAKAGSFIRWREI